MKFVILHETNNKTQKYLVLQCFITATRIHETLVIILVPNLSIILRHFSFYAILYLYYISEENIFFYFFHYIYVIAIAVTFFSDIMSQ